MPRDFSLSEQEVIALPVDELGLEVLRDVAANGEWNAGNWMIGAQSGYGRTSPAIRALEEGWAWLFSTGLVAIALDQHDSHAMFVTRLGRTVLDEGIEVVRARQRLALDLHPRIEAKVRRQYLMGEWELACFAAMKLVEVRVRELADESDSMIGAKLMTAAFSPTVPGPLYDPMMEGGEAVARMNLFSGAMGLFKNPTSHREVKFDDPAEAAEVILFADLLMRILDRVEVEIQERRLLESSRQFGKALADFIRPKGT